MYRIRVEKVSPVLTLDETTPRPKPTIEILYEQLFEEVPIDSLVSFINNYCTTRD